MRGAQRLRGRDAIRADPHRCAGAARDQQRFVAADARRRRRENPRRTFDARAITTRDHAGLEAGGAQGFDQRDDGRRLAGAADGHVADHHDRHANAHGFQPAERESGAARDGNRAEHTREGRERPRKRATLLPLAREACFETVFQSAHRQAARTGDRGRDGGVEAPGAIRGASINAVLRTIEK